MDRFVGLIGLALLACNTSGSARLSTAAQSSDPESISSLPGYRVSEIAVHVFGGQAHLLEVGPVTAPALLLVHGIGDAGARDFFPILPALARYFHVYAIDLPGFGRSTHGTALYSPDNYVEFLHADLRPRIAGAFALLGHSLGGAISLQYAQRYPEDVTKLGLVDVAGILHRQALVPWIAATGIGNLFAPAHDLTSGITGILVDHVASPEMLLSNELTRGQLLAGANQIAAAALIMHDFGPSIARLRTETLVIWGRHDDIAPLRTGSLLAYRLPTSQLTILEQSAHVPMESEPELLANTIVTWLQTTSDPSVRKSLFWTNVPALQSGDASRLGRCDNATGVQFTGTYGRIEIVGCRGVRLSEVHATDVRIWDSDVVIEGTRLTAPDVALYATRSQLELTGSIFAGKVAMRLDASELDVAGCDFTGELAALQSKRPSHILFSVSRIASPLGQHFLHDSVELGVDQTR